MQIGKVSFREIGNRWSAYYVIDTPKKKQVAIPLGSISMKVCEDFPARKTQFKELMKECAWDIIESITGVRPYTEGEVPAPDIERGRAPKGLIT